MRVLGIAGSLRQDSYNRALLRAAAFELPSGARLVEFDGLREIPPYDEDVDGRVVLAPVGRLRAALADADAVLIATPEYNAGVPGQLKNAVDWLSRPLRTNPLRGRPVAVVGASTGMLGAVGGQADLRKALARLGARVLDVGVAVPQAREQFDESGRLHSDELRAQLADVLAALHDEARSRLGEPVAA